MLIDKYIDMILTEKVKSNLKELKNVCNEIVKKSRKGSRILISIDYKQKHSLNPKPVVVEIF